MFRVSATLSEQVDPKTLQASVDATLKRIPGFAVKLRKGLFCNYFVHSSDTLHIQPDVINPCTEITRRVNDGFLLRVRYHRCEIALEIFHALTDGTGAMVFLKTLVADYLKRKGIEIPAENGILDCDETARPEEVADSFRQFAGGAHVLRREEPRAYQITGTEIPPQDIIITRGTIQTSELSQAAKSLNASITEYLTAVLMYTLNCRQLQEPLTTCSRCGSGAGEPAYVLKPKPFAIFRLLSMSGWNLA